MTYLYITGLPRSGTTGLANFLNAQDRVTVLRDYPILLRTAQYLLPPSVSTPLDAKTRNQFVSQAKAESVVALGEEPDITLDGAATAVDLYKRLLTLQAGLEDAIIGNKITASMPVLRHLMQDPEVKALYILRDIRDVILSGKNRFFQYNPIDAINMWRSEIRQVEELQALYPERILLIRYEDFVQRHADDALEEFLGLSLQWDIQGFRDRQNPSWRGNSSYQELSSNERAGLYTASVCRWRSEIDSDADVQIADLVCRKDLKRKGYEVARPSLGVLTLIRRLVRYSVWSCLMHIFRFMQRLSARVFRYFFH